MIFNIDLDRGVHTRSHPGTGMDIHMYVDDPGVYLNSHGTVVSNDLAGQAGFPVEEHARKRKVKLALKAAHDKVLSELAEADSQAKRIIAERGGFKIVDLGYDRHQLLDPDDAVLTPEHLPLQRAMYVLDQLVPPPEPVVEVVHSKPVEKAKK